MLKGKLFTCEMDKETKLGHKFRASLRNDSNPEKEARYFSGKTFEDLYEKLTTWSEQFGEKWNITVHNSKRLKRDSCNKLSQTECVGLRKEQLGKIKSLFENEVYSEKQLELQTA